MKKKGKKKKRKEKKKHYTEYKFSFAIDVILVYIVERSALYKIASFRLFGFWWSLLMAVTNSFVFNIAFFHL